MIDRPPVPAGNNWSDWGNTLSTYLQRVRDTLRWRRGDENTKQNGILIWDESQKSPVVSVDGEFIPLVLQDGSGIAYSNTDITAASANTAYTVAFDGISSADGVSIGTPASRVVFEKGGTFLLSFSVQITSSNSSLKNLWFWPRINGTDVDGSTIKVSIVDNGATIVMSRSALFSISADDYLEVAWATSDTAVTLESAPATAFAPATPSVTLSVTRVHQ
jgi:hypothetical protein